MEMLVLKHVFQIKGATCMD